MSNSDHDIERGVYQTPSNDDDLYDEYDDEEGFGRGPVFAIFAVIVLAAFVGIVWLAYQQGVRHGQASAPPIIQASNEPFRVAPDDPEGMAEPQESLTDEVLAGEGIGQETATIMPSAEEPIVTSRTETPQEEEVASAAPSSTGLAVPPPSSRVRDAGANDNLSAAETAAEEAAAEIAAREAELAAAEAEVIAEPEPEPVRQPELRTQTVTVDPEIEGPLPPEAVSLFRAGGTYVVQIASVPNAADADGVWNRLQSRHEPIVGSYVQDVQSVDLGERGTWYRLRVGYFATSDDANTVCNQLKDAGQDCLVASR